MVKAGTRSGQLERTSRGFQQDFEAVMGSDPLRAVIELVTNSDDAYVELESPTKGKIRVEVERHRGDTPTTIIVRDRAGGMTMDKMEQVLAKEGSRSSGFEKGRNIRGLLGRGAKDVVHFGPVRWISRKDGRSSEFALEYNAGPTGNWTLNDLGVIGKRETGTEARLEVQPTFVVPTHAGLRKNLSRHYQLRPILEDRRGRDVILVDLGQSRDETILYEKPVGKSLAAAEWLDIVGYPGEKLRLSLSESPESLDDGEPKEYWRHSLLIRSGRAAYDMYDGKFTREPWSIFMGRLFGEVEVPAIGRLINAFDDRLASGQPPGKDNPIRLVRRDRRGLVSRSEHPFVEALLRTIEGALAPHLERLKGEAEGRAGAISEDNQRRLGDVARLLSEFAQEEEVEGAAGSGEGSLPPLGLTVIPAVQTVQPGHRASFTVRFRPETPAVLAEQAICSTVTRNESGDETTDSLELKSRGEYFSATLRTPELHDGEGLEISLEVEDVSAHCLAVCEERAQPPIERLQFEHASYSLRDSVERAIRVIAPWGWAAELEDEARIQYRGDSSIRLLPGPLWFHFDETRQCALLTIRVRGTRVGASGTLEVISGGETATCDVSVSASGVSGFKFLFDDRPELRQRAFMSGSTLIVNAAHASVTRYLGRKSDRWPGQNKLHFRTMLAEIVTTTFARWTLLKRPELPKDPTQLMTMYQAKVDDWLPRVHRALVKNSET